MPKKVQETSQNLVMESSCTLVDGALSMSKSNYLCLMIDSCSNNSIEINLLECCEKDDFKFDAITAETEETDSAAGRVAAQLQDQTYKMFQRRR